MTTDAPARPWLGGVVVIDDSAADRAVLRRALLRLDPTTTVVEHADGRTLDRAGDTALVLVDLHLRGARGPTGLGVVERLRAAHPHLPVLVVSGSSAADDRAAAVAAGADGYLVKPMRFDDLVELLRDAVAAHARPGRGA